MADKSVLIRRIADGAEFSVVEADYKKHYPDEKYKVIGEENDTAFELVGVPTPKAARRTPKAKRPGSAKRVAAQPLGAVETPKPSEVISPPQVEGEPV